MNERLKQVKKIMHENYSIDFLIVSDKINYRYLSGFTGSNGLLVVGDEREYLLVDGRYTEQAEQQTENICILTTTPQKNQWQYLAEIVGDGSVGFERSSISYLMYLELESVISEQKGKLIETIHLIEQLRMIKEPTEIRYLKEAAMLADQTFEYIKTIIKPGMSELDVANEIDYYSKRIGSEGPAFETIVASGNRTALPHAHASRKVIQPDELIMIDFGCMYHGYHSDMTRTFALGKAADKIKETYQQVLNAQKQAIQAIETGKTLKEIDQTARMCLEESGIAEYFSHGLGHGIGLSCHEYPVVNHDSTVNIREGMVFTVEPGIYFPGDYGIRIEDDIFITADGRVKSFTQTSKEWMELEWN
ncbi:Xaa-Pro peptidase family protein [Enterococcus sp. BWT-B8]|uniref:M24 family metallopeptidase n=1 Tax=Enterococcus sp. BWT-B8 TaxID=2885157 RepID=UPI001E4FD131|nr:Xaa-Pro peptidase family protein [Enterococcus sp. BWT-B8]MCB5952555.1 Xaa-Pro peptidase family protein [Enterococcus sp. BWT-B8]